MALWRLVQELREARRRIVANMADYIRAFECGDPVEAVKQLTPGQIAALGEVPVDQFIDDDARVRRIRFKLYPKLPALELLGKHHKLYVERHQYDWGAGLADRLAAALARVDGDREGARVISHEREKVSARRR